MTGASRGLAATLSPIGTIVDMVSSGSEALELLKHYDYDIVVVNSLLPDMDGCEAVKRMRGSKIDTPVLMLSSANRAQVCVRALAIGADDVMNKPIEPAEFVARVQAIVRRSKGFSKSSLNIGNVELDLHSQGVSVNGHKVYLTGKEQAILELLMLRKGMVLTKDAFLNHLYGGMDEPEVKIIDVFICKLRKKLARAGADNLIGTVWGRGYTIRDNIDDNQLRQVKSQTNIAA
jgi:two-component system cell cycle response regulator CtrA